MDAHKFQSRKYEHWELHVHRLKSTRLYSNGFMGSGDWCGRDMMREQETLYIMYHSMILPCLQLTERHSCLISQHKRKVIRNQI